MAVNSPFGRAGNNTLGGSAAVVSMDLSTKDVLHPVGGGSGGSVPSNPVTPDDGGRSTPSLPTRKPSVNLNAGSENNQRNTEVVGRLGGNNGGGGENPVLDVPINPVVSIEETIVVDGAKEDKSFEDDDYFGMDNALDMGTGGSRFVFANRGDDALGLDVVSEPVSSARVIAPAASVGAGVKKFDKKKVMIIAAFVVAVVIVVMVFVKRGDGSKKRRR